MKNLHIPWVVVGTVSVVYWLSLLVLVSADAVVVVVVTLESVNVGKRIKLGVSLPCIFSTILPGIRYLNADYLKGECHFLSAPMNWLNLCRVTQWINGLHEFPLISHTQWTYNY